ncbi:hypothetical protein PLESTM_000351500 [Pleodorina starrii]|nr:hypothetical protein PLESTM_000351500 [Pleodorina starrii]
MLSRSRLANTLDAAVRSSWNTYAALSSGTRPTSVLREDIGIEVVFGQHHAAAQHLQEALRDSIKERLAVLLGRRKGRPLDLGSLQRLSVSDLMEACRQARLPTPPGEHPQQLAAALHSWLHVPEAAAAAAAQSGGGGAVAAAPGRGWDRPASLRHSNWMRHTGFGAAATAADTGAAGAAAGEGAAGSGTPATTTGEAAAATADEHAARVSSAAADAAAAADADADADAEAAAEAALRAAAEREADALFDDELRRRLQQAAATAATTEAATVAVGGAGATDGGPSTAEPAGVGTGGGDGGGGGGVAAAAMPLEALSGGSGQLGPQGPGPKEAQPQLQQQQQQQQQVDLAAAARHRESDQFLSTTELLASAAAGQGGGPSDASASYGRSHVGNVATSYVPSYGIAASGSGGGDGESLFDSPPPSTGPPRPSEVVAAVRRSLGRAGYGGGRKDPTCLTSLLLLSRAELMRLMESFNAGDLDTAGQSREQLAVRLLQMMSTAESGDDTSAAVGGASSTVPTEAEAAEAEAGVGSGLHVPDGTTRAPAAAAAREGAGDRRRTVQWIRRGEREEAEAEVGAGGRWDEERAALGDPRRRQVLAAARRRQELMAAAAQPEEIATWLVKARAQDVVLLCSDPDAEADSGDLGTPSGSGSGSAASFMVIATALSQRHAYACAEAVRYQVRERLEELASGSEPGSGSGSGSGSAAGWAALDASLRGAPSVSGFNGADWLSLEAGRVQVHVLTPQARRYYRLEELLAGATSSGSSSGSRGRGRGGSVRHRVEGDGRPAGRWEGAAAVAVAAVAPSAAAARARPRMRLFGPWTGDGSGGRLPDTLETARVETATEA